MADTLIEVMSEAVAKATDEFVRGLAPAGMGDNEHIARSVLRSIHDHGPTQRMLEAYSGNPCQAATGYAAFRAMLAAELEGGANG